MKAVPIDPEAEVLKLKSRVARRHKYTLTPPGPVQRYPFSELMELRRIGHLEYVCRLQKTYGNLVHFRWGPMWLYFVNDPALIERILVKDHHAFVKSRGLRMAKKILGEGLLTSEGQSHRRQRRLMQPAFHKKRLDQYAETMVRVSAATAHRWKPGQQVDMSQEMMRLTLGVVGWTLFDADVEGEAREIGDALKGLLQYLERITSPLGILMEKFPLPGGGKFKQGLDRINQTIYRIIEERRSSTEDRGDLLSMLLMDQDGETMSNQQVRDEAITLFLAGHETTAIALSWAWYEIAKNPEIEAKLHAELDAQLGGRIPTVQDLPNLTYTYKIFEESLRKYPPAFIFGRKPWLTIPSTAMSSQKAASYSSVLTCFNTTLRYTRIQKLSIRTAGRLSLRRACIVMPSYLLAAVPVSASARASPGLKANWCLPPWPKHGGLSWLLIGRLFPAQSQLCDRLREFRCCWSREPCSHTATAMAVPSRPKHRRGNVHFIKQAPRGRVYTIEYR